MKDPSEEDFKRAGQIIRNFKEGKTSGLTDSELDLVIQTQEQVVKFLVARGPEWMLSWSPLIQELELGWKSFKMERNRQKLP